MSDPIAQTSIYLNAEDREVMEKLQARTGLGRSAVVRFALHRVAEDDAGLDQINRLAKIKTAAEEIISLAQS